MALALQQAERGMYTTTPNPRVGCVIVREQRVIGAGFTQPPGGNHAEIEALHDAQANGHDVRGATVYVTLEPCSHFGRTPPCADALDCRAGRRRVGIGHRDPNPLVAVGGWNGSRRRHRHLHRHLGNGPGCPKGTREETLSKTQAPTTASKTGLQKT